LDLLSALDGQLHSVGNASAWGSGNLALSDFIFNVHGCGFHLNRSIFDAFLRTSAADAGATIVGGAQLVCRGPARLRIKGHERLLKFKWIVDATGRAATAARAHGARRIPEDALVAFFARFVSAAGPPDNDSRTLIESCREGWWYTTRMSPHERVVGFLTDKDLVPVSAAVAESSMLDRIKRTNHIRDFIESYQYKISGKVRGLDAATSRLDRFAGEDWVAVGDAALSFDPLSSQGIFNAIYTGKHAAESVLAALSGARGAMKKYTASLEAIHSAYRRNLRWFYGRESRWGQEEFWKRRLQIQAQGTRRPQVRESSGADGPRIVVRTA
jgi:flavin-dependent dehydrogenase